MIQQFHIWLFTQKKQTKKNNSKSDIIPIFIAALFTLVKMWKKTKCPQQMNG